MKNENNTKTIKINFKDDRKIDEKKLEQNLSKLKETLTKVETYKELPKKPEQTKENSNKTYPRFNFSGEENKQTEALEDLEALVDTLDRQLTK